MKIIVYAVSFSSLCPWALLVGGCGLLLSHIRVSVLLAVRYERPPRLGDEIAKMTELLLPVIVYCHYFANIFLLFHWWWGTGPQQTNWFVFIWVWGGLLAGFLYALNGPAWAIMVRMVSTYKAAKNSDKNDKKYSDLRELSLVSSHNSRLPTTHNNYVVRSVLIRPSLRFAGR